MKKNDNLAFLAPPQGKMIKAVLDTDTYNEVDDQFALVYALLSPRIDLKAVFATPFHNRRSASPKDGMEKSYDEILHILKLLNIADNNFVHKGSEDYMSSVSEPVKSPAADKLIELAKSMPKGEKLYVMTVGCATNISSAIVTDPSIIENIVVVWLGGHPTFWPDTREFNLIQDVYASRVLFDSGVTFVRFPCAQVTDKLLTTIAELNYYLECKTAIGNYLAKTVSDYAPKNEKLYAWSKVIWDIITVAWLDLPEAITYTLMPTPRLVGDHTTPKDELCFNFDYRRPIYCEAVSVNRDMIFRRLFKLINEYN